MESYFFQLIIIIISLNAQIVLELNSGIQFFDLASVSFLSVSMVLGEFPYFLVCVCSSFLGLPRWR